MLLSADGQHDTVIEMQSQDQVDERVKRVIRAGHRDRVTEINDRMSKRTPIDSVALMRRVARRDQAAFETLYLHFVRLVHQMALRVLGDETAAEEVVQDVFFQVWRWPEKWDAGKGGFAAWLLTVTRHTAIDHQRRLNRRGDGQVPLDAVDHQLSDVPSGLSHEDRSLLQSLLRRLPAEQRQVILLAFLRGMTHDQIATRLGIPPGTVKSRLRLGMEKLRTGWAAQQEETER